MKHAHTSSRERNRKGGNCKWVKSNDFDRKRGSCWVPLFITASLGVTSGRDLQTDCTTVGSYSRGHFPLESRLCIVTCRNDNWDVKGRMSNGSNALSRVFHLTQMFASTVAQAISNRDGILKRLGQPRTGRFFLQTRIEWSSTSSQWL